MGLAHIYFFIMTTMSCLLHYFFSWLHVPPHILLLRAFLLWISYIYRNTVLNHIQMFNLLNFIFTHASYLQFSAVYNCNIAVYISLCSIRRLLFHIKSQPPVYVFYVYVFRAGTMVMIDFERSFSHSLGRLVKTQDWARQQSRCWMPCGS